MRAVAALVFLANLAACAAVPATENSCYRYTSFLSHYASFDFAEYVAQWPDVAPYITKDILAGIALPMNDEAKDIAAQYDTYNIRGLSEKQKIELIPRLISLVESYAQLSQELRTYDQSYIVARDEIIRSSFSRAEAELNTLTQEGKHCMTQKQFSDEASRRAIAYIKQNANKSINYAPSVPDAPKRADY